jgi:putative N6-adenine-specific DNA methylase
MYVSLKTKDAIVDQFKAKSRKRPTVNTENPDITIHVHLSADTLTLTLDSSGESLHKRGYRVAQNEASMNEILAAGILKLAGWDGKCDFYDTMCGSGTLPVEAALMARNIPPGIFRKEFAFEKWKDFDAELFEEVYNDDYEVPFECKIYASDIASINTIVSEKNAKGAGVLKDIEFSTVDFASFTPSGKKGLLVINPPSGERMNDRKFEPLYGMIGDQMKKNFSGFKAWVFSNSEEGFKKIGMRPTEKIKLNNGSLDCSLNLYEVYDGSRKINKQNPDKQNTRPEGGRRGHFSDVKREGHRRSDSPGSRSGNFKSSRRDDARRPDSSTSRRSNNFGNNRDTSHRAEDALEARRSEFHKARLSAYGNGSAIDKKIEGKGEKKAYDEKGKDFARTGRTGKRPRK